MLNNLREFIALLESHDELKRITTEVDRNLEITEITDRCVKSNGPALMFENVTGFSEPVVTNLFGTHHRMAMALGVDDINDLGEKVESILGLVKNPPTSMMDKLKALKEVSLFARTQPNTVKSAPCQEIVLQGDNANLEIFPHLKCWPLDAGHFMTMPLVISKDPTTHRRNVGIYRMQVYGPKSAGLHWQTHKGGTAHMRTGEYLGFEQMEVAIALGADPCTMWSGSLPLPPDMDEFAISGVIRGKSVDLVKCKTIDIEVPAQAEIVLEGYLLLGQSKPEGPFGDHTGYYSMQEEYPVFHLNAITHRKNPIYPATVVGRPPSEDFFMGKAAERLMLPALKMTLPEVLDINMPAEGVFHNLVIVSIRKEYPGHARKVMHALWGLGLLMLSKTIIVVDESVDVQNLSEVTWRVTSNIDPQNDIVFVDGPVDDLDHSSKTPKFGSKMGIDATKKDELDGRNREWPPDIIMDDKIKDLVDRKWQEYGL